jgi:hypothetical protein
MQLIYTAQCILGYNYGTIAHGLANNGMTDAHRRTLPATDPEYAWRYSSYSDPTTIHCTLCDVLLGVSTDGDVVRSPQSDWIQDPGSRLDNCGMFALDAQAECDVLLSSSYSSSTLEVYRRNHTNKKQSRLERYQISIRIVMGLVVATFIAVFMTIYMSCRPFNRYLQIYLDPRDCMPGGHFETHPMGVFRLQRFNRHFVVLHTNPHALEV